MAETGVAALGTVISIASTVSNVISFDGPSETVGTVDVSNFSSTNAEFLKLLPDGGEMTVTVNYDPGVHDAISDLMPTSVILPSAVTITFPDMAATVVSFNAWVTGFSISADIEGAAQATITLKVTGAIDWDDAV